MKKIRIISALMSLIMIIGVLANLSVLPAFAAVTDSNKEESNVAKDKDHYIQTYLNKNYTLNEKIKSMTKRLEDDKYAFYVHGETGEWALENKLTGQYLFSNPYDVGKTTASEVQKIELLSQVIINYNDGTKSDTYTSFEDCVMLQQVKVKQLKNAVRVEYTVGNQETRKLLPMMIERTRFEEEILANIPDDLREKETLKSFYQLKTLTGRTEKDQTALKLQFPILEECDIYVFDETNAKEQQKIRMETLIKTYCNGYTFEDLESDHSYVGYVSKDKAPAVFKFAIEYSLNDFGVDARLGANGIRFDESVYTLDDIQFLPYVGAGNVNNEGYMFIPDGSGALIRFEDVLKEKVTISGKLYGQDYTFHKITGTHQQSMRLPVFGVVETTSKTESFLNENGELDKVTYDVNQGYMAIIMEGDALSTITAETGGTENDYNTVYTSFNPRPADTYSIDDSVSGGSSATWTVVSDRKYTGNYKIRYVMLEDASLAAKQGEEYKYYNASYMGMANAYRDYLYEDGQLTLLTDKDVEADIPLYLETFGTIDTTEKFLSFPITVETPLTSFENLKTMYTNLNEKGGISNINFKLSGFANGGMSATVPSKVDIQDKVGGDKGFKEFLSFAETNKIGVYPDFDFAYLSDTGMFDGFSYRKNATRTIDDRYTQKKEYDPVYQTLMETGNVVISVSAFTDFYKGFKEDYTDLGGTSLSVSTLGYALNTDFDEDESYNREDSKKETKDFFEDLKGDFGSVMSDAGNAYVFKYVDHLLNVSLDSSRYLSASQAIPFMGIVLHGAVEIAGAPINTTGNMAYEVLKLIENGANPYFMVSYENVSELKDNELYANYFSVGYESWEEDIIKYYEILNEALKDVQTETIVDHEFVQGERVPTDEEIEDDKNAVEEYEAKKEVNKVHEQEKARRAEILKAKLEALKQQATETPENPETPETPVVPETPEAEEPTDDETTENTEENTEDTTEETETPDEKEEVEEKDTLDVKSKYYTEKGTVVKVTYSNGKTFVLNYNDFDITVDGELVKAYNFIIVEATKDDKEETTEDATGDTDNTETPDAESENA